MQHPDAPPGKTLKYGRAERERRFLLRAVPAGEVVGTAAITDRYITGTRLRLRRSVETTAAGTHVFHKLTQKIPAPDGGPGLITTAYLSAAEHAVFAALPARILTKTRHSIPPLGVDVFDPPLAGLVLAEMEFDDDDAMRTFACPFDTVAEVTHDPRFTGGAFAGMTSDALAALLAEHGIHAG